MSIVTINKNQDLLLSRVTVRLKDVKTKKVVGTGILYYSEDLRDNVYVITASHCLHSDGDSFQILFPSLIIEFYNPSRDKYVPLTMEHIDDNLLFKEVDKDLAVIILNKSEVKNCIGDIPKVRVVTTRQNKTQFIVKGFPNATMGQELDVIYPTWKQELTTVPKFQLQLNEDYDDYATQGFSGSGIFLNDNEYIYLYGIFTRFRPEDRGKVIYGQHIESVNELLANGFLPSIKFNYLGDNNLNHSFFKDNVEKAIHNLGQRYSKELNLELPISKLFNDLVRDKNFEYRFLQAIDTWIDKNRYSKPKNDSILIEIKTQQHQLKNDVEEWVKSISLNIIDSIDIQWIVDEIGRISDLSNKKFSELYELQRKKIKEDGDKAKSYSYRTPYESEISDLRKIQTNNDDLESDLGTKVNIKLTNFPVLILKGDAGSGKSHLLGDIAQSRLDRGRPSVLLLGQHFKSEVGSVDKNILNLLGLEMNLDSFLKSLNQIGEQLNERIPILIDALNEGGGVGLWRDEVFGLINNILKFPFLGIVLSVRTTYFDLLFPDDINPNITITSHEGFTGNEYAALKLFCEHYGLKQPDFPILAPEFTKPLFLILICKGVGNSPSKEFPQGFQGIGTIFNYYVKAVETQFKKRSKEYLLAPNVVHDAIKKFSLECFEKEKTVLRLEDAIEFFLEEFPRQPNLLNDLIQESVFIRNCSYDYETKKDEEVIYFAYERFGDFFTAKELIKQYQSKDEVLSIFSKEKRLGKLGSELLWRYGGIVESFAIVLPEIHGLEIFEVYSWMYRIPKDDDYQLRNHIEWHIHYLFDSLKWRSLESINDQKILDWVNEDFIHLHYDSYLNMLIELSTIKNHPFNSDRLHKILSSYKMSERDGFWQQFTLWYSGYDDNGVGNPLRRLLDWAWSPNISDMVDADTALLASQTLSWVLASTNRKLRDEATKAIVNLLEQQPKTLIELLTRFMDVDDMYIKERLYAVAYGCILRTRDLASIELIGNYVYNNIFKSVNPPEHILLRDYARNTLEYMIYRGKGTKINIDEIRPPYKSKLPIYPSEDEISIYDIDYKSPDYDKENDMIFNRIHYSVMSWDFGEKTVGPILDKFCPVSFTTEKEYKSYIEKLNSKQKKHIYSFAKLMNEQEILHGKNNRHKIENLGGQEIYDSLLEKNKLEIEEGIRSLKILFKSKADYIIDRILPYLDNVDRFQNFSFHRKSFNVIPVKRWIVKRAHELGYDVKLHGSYDRRDVYGHQRLNIERIGKKYQWIAYHEILSILSDNHKISGWSSDKKFEYYKGPWEVSARDIDPVFTRKDAEELPDDDMMILEKEYKWWHDPTYTFWNQENFKWIRNIDDLPSVKHIICKKDETGKEWLFMKKSVEWKMPKPIGVEKYSNYRKSVYYMIQGYIIKRNNKQKIIDFLQDKNLWGRLLPKAYDESDQLLNREKYWSPAYESSEREDPWREIYYNHKSTGLFVMISTLDAKARISEDKSGAESSYSIPCEQLFNGLGLIYAPNDGDFINSTGELVIQNIPYSGGLLVNKKLLIEYLDENNLEIIWTLNGEKMASISPDNSRSYRGTPCGVFYLENGEIKGQLNYYERD